MRKHGANPREVELTFALASLKLDLVLSQEEARLHGQARKPGRRRVEDPSHQLVPLIKHRIGDRFLIFISGMDRAVEGQELSLEIKKCTIVVRRVVLRHWVSSYRARLLCVRENTAAKTRARRQPIAPPITAPLATPIPVSITWPIIAAPITAPIIALA